MLLFFLFHGTYVLAHFYVFLKIESVFQLSTAGNIISGLILAFLALSPILTYIFTLRGGKSFTRVFAFFGYLWMGFLILFFISSVLLDLYNLGILFGDYILNNDLAKASISPLSGFFAPLFLSVCLNIYGYFGARKLRVKRLTVKTTKLPEGTDKLTIAHISDVHLGIIVREKILDKLIKTVIHESPELIVSTGDLIDGGLEQIQHLLDKLRSMKARSGKFAVIGNHEYYSGIKASQKYLESAGFTVLRGYGVTVDGLINIAGMDDIEGSRLNNGKDSATKSESEILSILPPGLFTLLLKHKPYVIQSSLGLFDLQLSGHTHKGQIFPINIAVRLFLYPHSSYKKLSKGSAINVSGGVGTAGPPVRLFSPPEIIFIDVVSEKEDTE
jgi:predicted MPP superfamily phosphohydrolase